MKLISNSFKEGEVIPAKYTCDGENISPHLAWSDFPKETKSFVLVCNDPDAPAGDWIHWLVINIPKKVNEIQENCGEPKDSQELINDFGKKEYGGACPPEGEHHYYFTVYALDIETFEDVDKTDFVKKIQKHVLDSGQLMGVYSRE